VEAEMRICRMVVLQKKHWLVQDTQKKQWISLEKWVVLIINTNKMKKNSILLVVGIIAVGAVGYAIYKSIKNAQDSQSEK
jgi:uncharacterized membrane protein YebE (DUF533 family)